MSHFEQNDIVRNFRLNIKDHKNHDVIVKNKYSVSEKTIKKCSMFVAKMCSKMAEDDVPHNVAFVRGKPLRHAPNSLSDSDEYPVRVYIWPRRPTLGARVSYRKSFNFFEKMKFVKRQITHHLGTSDAATPNAIIFRVTQISIVLLQN